MPKKENPYKFDIISIGDATLDSFIQLHDASVLCSLDKQDCWLCLNYAEKIPITRLDTSIGGNACNNAVGSSRLGLKTTFYTIIGDDETGHKIIQTLKKEKVNLDYLKVQKKSPSNYSVVLRYKKERTILVYHEPRHYILPKLPKAKWIYLTSMGKSFASIHEQLLKQIKQDGFKLAFNPGTHQLMAGAKVLEPILKACSLIIVNKEEAETITGNHNPGTIKSLLKDLHHLGPDIVIITDGPKGAYGYNGKCSFFAKPAAATPIERTGAGDSFATGVLAALCQEKDLVTALTWGAANSASVIEHIGPQAGLLTKPQLLKRLSKSKINCRKI